MNGSKYDVIALTIAAGLPAALLAVDNATTKSVLSLAALLVVIVIMKFSTPPGRVAEKAKDESETKPGT